jgi:acetyl-CoA carboxylase biotin carboxyl carrier protein
MMSLTEKIRKMIEILRTEDLDEIEVRTWFSGIRIARRRGAAAAAPEGDVAEEPAAGAGRPVEPSEQESAAVPAEPADDEGLEEILSPMVGTFYRAAGPENDPFIMEGSRVETGQVLCIIEAMKLMNEIETEKSGVIRKILVEDSQPVEFGQPLFLMESA